MLKFALLFSVFIFRINCIRGGDTVTVVPHEVSAKIGEAVKVTCKIRKELLFLMSNPLKWEIHDRYGVADISTFTTIEAGFEDKYKVQTEFDGNTYVTSYSLEFIGGMKEKYEGIYKCVLHDTQNAVFIQDQVDVTVKQKSPGLRSDPTNVTAKIGDTATLLCVVEDMIPTEVGWYRGDDFLYVEYVKHQTTRYNMDFGTYVDSSAPNEWNLVVSKVDMEDAGYYECDVRNDEYIFTRRIRLHVDNDILSVNPSIVSAEISEQTTEFTCRVKKDVSFLIKNPLKWERHAKDEFSEVISVFGNVESKLRDKYSVQVETSLDGVDFKLTLLQGMKKEYEGFFKCVLYDSNNNKLAQDDVEVKVIDTNHQSS